MNDRRPTLFVVEDSADDLFILRRALKSAGLDVEVEHASDGESAIALLEGKVKALKPGEMQSALPALVLLDLKLPRISGLEVLQWIRRQNTLTGVPVIVLSSSRQRTDVQTAYDLGANAYLVKPPSIAELTEMMRTLDTFWMKFNCCPHRLD